jgi:(3S)-malyl-CoA thioesterase
MNMIAPRSALYVPASNLRAIEKARTLPADMVILDLEDAVKTDTKNLARTQAVAAVAGGFGGRPVAVRINGAGTLWHDDDVTAVATARPDFVVIPKVEETGLVDLVATRTGLPVIAMIETPFAVLHAHLIVTSINVAGLIVGTNDLAHELRLPASRTDRSGMSAALQLIVLASRLRDMWVLDGVFNALDQPEGLEAECREGRALGFDGKTLIHPGQIDTANRIFSPSDTEIEDAQALIAVASGGAERFRDRMIETMHVDMAQQLLARVRRG